MIVFSCSVCLVDFVYLFGACGCVLTWLFFLFLQLRGVCVVYLCQKTLVGVFDLLVAETATESPVRSRPVGGGYVR